MHIVITRLCFKGSKGQSVEQTGAIVCDALTSDSTPQQPLDSMQFNATCMHNVTTRPNRLCIIAPSPHRFCATSHRLCRIDCASSGREATESTIQRSRGGAQKTLIFLGFGGVNNLPGDFQTFSYTLNISHSNTAGTMFSGGVQNRFVGALFRVLVFIRALFVHFQGGTGNARKAALRQNEYIVHTNISNFTGTLSKTHRLFKMVPARQLPNFQGVSCN